MVLDGISLAARHYAAKHNKPAILFVDNLTILAKNDAHTFERLIRFAKTEADTKNLVVNFVASEGHTPRQLAELSEKSRLADVIEIGDLDTQEAIQFLTTHGVNETTAKSIFDIAGGRITLLNEAQLRVERGQTINAIKDAFVQRAENEFGDLTLPQDPLKITPKQKEAWKQIIKIYDSPTREVSYTDFKKSLGSASLVDELLQQNVFAYHPRRNTVSLQSRPVELFVENEIGAGLERHKLWESRKK